MPGVSAQSSETAGRAKKCSGGTEKQVEVGDRWRWVESVVRQEDRTRSRAVKGRDEEHGGKRIGLAWKMGGHKEDNRARRRCEQRVRSEPWPGGRRTRVQKQKTRGSSCLWFRGTVFGCLQSEVIDYGIRLVLFWPCDFRCRNLSPLRRLSSRRG